MSDRQSDPMRVWKNDSTLRVTVAVFIAAAGVSYVSGATLLLFGLAILSPIVLLLFTGQRQAAVKTDPKTGLMDATSFKGFISEMMDEDGYNTPMACIMFRVDEIARMHRDMGALAITSIRTTVAERLQSVLRRGDRVAYLGDEIFAVAICHLRAPELGGVLSLIDRAQTAVGEPIMIDNTSVRVTLSSGFCLASKATAPNGEALVSSAHFALNDALRQGPAGVRAFSSRTPAIVGDGKAAPSEVFEALANGQIIPWFQPQISTDTGKVTGFEALARWDHPERGIIPPSEFLPTLEDAQRMEALSETMLHHGLKAIRNWDRAKLEVPAVAVNFSTQELRNPSLTERIKWDVDRFDLDPARLTVEILETVVSHSDDDIITRNIRALHNQGFKIDLDDFGTGHASLANIRRFAVDRVKIDRSFVTHADDDPEQQRMIAAIVGMAEQLQIETLAEGVETLGEQSILSQLGVNSLQGYAIAKPMPFEDTEQWLRAHAAKLEGTPTLPRKSA